MEKHSAPDSELPDWAKPKPKGAPPSEVKNKSLYALRYCCICFKSYSLILSYVILDKRKFV